MSRDTWGGDEIAPMSYNKWAYVYGNPVNYTDPSGHDVGCNVDDPRDPRCHILQPIINKLPICTPSPTNTPSPSINFTKRAQIIHDWALANNISTAEVVAGILQHEAYPAYLNDSDKWLMGDSSNPRDKRPVYTIFKEATTRWFWSWMKYMGEAKTYGGVANTDEDREVMLLNWMVPAMQSENGLTENVLVDYQNALLPQFLDITQDLTNPATNSSWKVGNGMWSWANASLFGDEGIDILNNNHRYKFSEGSTAWYIYDAETVIQAEPYRIK